MSVWNMIEASRTAVATSRRNELVTAMTCRSRMQGHMRLPSVSSSKLHQSVARHHTSADAHLEAQPQDLSSAMLPSRCSGARASTCSLNQQRRSTLVGLLSAALGWGGGWVGLPGPGAPPGARALAAAGPLACPGAFVTVARHCLLTCRLAYRPIITVQIIILNP
jgi:hypothetical protein